MEIYMLWGVRIGIVLLLIGIFWPSKKRRNVLAKMLRRQEGAMANEQLSPWLQWVDRVSEHPIFRPFLLKPNSDEVFRLETKLHQAGLPHIHPNIVQFFRIILPPIGAFVLLCLYLGKSLSTQVMNINPSTSQVPDIASSVGGMVQVKGVVEQTAVSSGINWIVVIWIITGSLLFYFIPNLVLNLKIKS